MQNQGQKVQQIDKIDKAVQQTEEVSKENNVNKAAQQTEKVDKEDKEDKVDKTAQADKLNKEDKVDKATQADKLKKEDKVDKAVQIKKVDEVDKIEGQNIKNKKEEKPINKKEQVLKQERRINKSGYRLEQLKTFEISKGSKDTFNQTILMKQISFALFGGRRFKYIILTSTLNHFYTALFIADIFNRRVPDLDMIIDLKTVKFQQFESEEDKIGKLIQHSIFNITLTKYATQEHKKSIGYNPGKKLQDIEAPITRLIQQNFKRRNQRKGNKNDRRNDKYNNNNHQRQYNKNYKNNQKGQRKKQNIRRQKDQQREDRPRRVEQEDRNHNKNINKNNKQDKDKPKESGKNKGHVEQNERKYTRSPERYQKDNDYKRGQQRTRGTRGDYRGRGEQRGQGEQRTKDKNMPEIAPQRYRAEHLKKAGEDRGERRPRRQNRYSQDQD